MFLLAVLVMGLVLAALYENLLDPLIILITVPLALLGALAGLVLRGLPLDVYGQMGLLMLVSLTAKNAILIVEFANQRMAEGLDLDTAIRGAAVARLRPILMTSCAMIAGMLPLALGMGEGGDQTAPLGRAVMGGLIFGTFATLTVVPAAYAWVMGAAGRASLSVDPDDPQSPHYHPDHAVS